MRGFTTAVTAALSLVVVTAPVDARPFAIDDLLRQASFGAQLVDPSGRWIAYEQRPPYDQIGRYDLAVLPSRAAGEIMVASLDAAEPPRPLIEDGSGVGATLAAFSPSGTRLALYRLRARRWQLGLVTMATGAVRWLDVAPRSGGQGRAIQWLDDETLLVLHRTDGKPPPAYRTAWIAAERLPDYWETAARGGTASTTYGSGAYASVRERGAPTAVLKIDAANGSQRELARGEFFDLELSPDGRHVALFARGPDIQPRPGQPVRGVAGTETEETRVSILDLWTGRLRDICADCDALPQLLTWSPRGDTLLAFVRAAGQPWPLGRLVQVRAADGRMSPTGEGLIPEVTTNPVVVAAGWMGDTPILFARPSGASRADWFALGRAIRKLTSEAPAPSPLLPAIGPRGFMMLSRGELWRVDRAGGAERVAVGPFTVPMTQVRGLDGVRLGRAVGANPWLLQTGERGAAQLARAHPGGLTVMRNFTNLYGPLVGISEHFGTAVVRQSGNKGGEALVRLLPDGALSPIVTLNRHLAETDAPRVEPVRHTSPDGEALTSWLFLPPRPPGGAAPPLIVRPYVGYAFRSAPTDLYMEEGFMQNLRMLVGHGYAVLVPSLPTPAGGLMEPMDRLAERILAAEAAARADPRLSDAFDPSRQAILGWSFGGYSTMAAITQTDHFRAAVAVDGISDMMGNWSRLSLVRQLLPEEGYLSNWATGTVEETQPQLAAPPWDAQARYLRNSPLWAADRINTPLLLIHGWRDPISPAASEAMYSALFRQNKDAQLVIYWGAGHQPTSPGDVADVWARIFAFLDGRLGFTPPAGAAPRPSRPEPGSANTAPRPRSPQPTEDPSGYLAR